MSRRTGMIVIIVSAVIFGCCSLGACITSVGVLRGGGTTFTAGGAVTPIPPAYGVLGILLAVVFAAVPAIIWHFFVRGKNGKGLAATGE